MKRQRRHGPHRDRVESEVGPSRRRAQSQQNQVRIAAGGHRAKGRVDRTPGVDFHPERQQERPFEQTSEHVSAHDQRGRRVAPQQAERVVSVKAHRPGQIPERWMDEVQAVVEHVTGPTRRARHARQLAVHRIQKRHQPRARQTGAVLAADEQPRRHADQQPTRPGHPVRRHVAAGEQARHRPRRPGPDPLRHRVGDALVGGLEKMVFDPGLRVVADGKHVCRRGFAQRGRIGCDQVIGPHRIGGGR